MERVSAVWPLAGGRLHHAGLEVASPRSAMVCCEFACVRSFPAADCRGFSSSLCRACAAGALAARRRGAERVLLGPAGALGPATPQLAMQLCGFSLADLQLPLDSTFA